jgi:hypothetical protein
VACVRWALALAAVPQQQQQQREHVLAAPCLPLLALQSLLLRPDVALHSCSSSDSVIKKTARYKSWLSFSKQEAEAVAALALADYAAALTAATAATGTATATGEVSHELTNSDWSALLLAVCDAATAAASADGSASSVHSTEGAVRVLLHQLNSADSTTAGSTTAAAADDSMEVVADGAR